MYSLPQTSALPRHHHLATESLSAFHGDESGTGKMDTLQAKSSKYTREENQTMLVLNQMPSFVNTMSFRWCLPRRQGREVTSAIVVDATMSSHRSLVSICRRETSFTVVLSLLLGSEYFLLYGGIYAPNPDLPTLCPNNLQPQYTSPQKR